MNYVFLAGVAFLINIPFGFIRGKYAKMTMPWLFWIHASIPVLIALRLSLHTSNWFIPITIALAIGGQFLGNYMRRKKTDNDLTAVLRPYSVTAEEMNKDEAYAGR